MVNSNRASAVAAVANAPALDPGYAGGTPPHRAIPHFFESAERPLYGVYHPPQSPRRGAPAVVYCHTLGVEQVTSNRVEAESARAAAALGFPGFRYHARGHGDSSGDFAAVTFATLVEDALAAAAEARRRSGAARVVWIGVRFGALVAAEAMRQDETAAGCALWEPVHSAEDYFRAMLRNLLFSQVVKGRRPDATVAQLLERIGSEGRVDVHGYYLHQALYESARGLTLASLLAGWSGATLLTQVQKRGTLAPAHAALVTALEGRGARVTVTHVNEEPGWHFISNPAWEGADVVRDTRNWLDALA